VVPRKQIIFAWQVTEHGQQGRYTRYEGETTLRKRGRYFMNTNDKESASSSQQVDMAKWAQKRADKRGTQQRKVVLDSEESAV
jgi:hypothetical protein